MACYLSKNLFHVKSFSDTDPAAPGAAAGAAACIYDLIRGGCEDPPLST